MKIKSLITRSLDMQSYACIEGQVEVAKELSNAKFDLICFTGNTQKGRAVAEAAGKNLVPCILQLGGKCPAIVDENANIEIAALKIGASRLANAGQVCIAPDYVLVHYSVTDKFTKLVSKAMQVQWQNGKDINAAGRVVVNKFHHNRLCDLMKDHQGSVVLGNDSPLEDENLTPTVILNPSKDSALMNEEIFGPILPIITF